MIMLVACLFFMVFLILMLIDEAKMPPAHTPAHTVLHYHISLSKDYSESSHI
jgi:hypothetical protein